MKRWPAWISWIVIFSLLVGCSSVGSYVKENYTLVDVRGKGKDAAKMYVVENKDVPAVAEELSSRYKPLEMSDPSPEQMFLVYDHAVVHIQKDPENDADTLVEISSPEYAKEHYDSSFLEGYLTAALLHSLFGGDWQRNNSPADVRGSPSAFPGTGQSNKQTETGQTGKPVTGERTGSFTTKAGKTESPGLSSANDQGIPSGPAASSSGTFGTYTTKSNKSYNSSHIRKNDGSTPSYKKLGKPRTKVRIGSFSRRR